MAEWESFRYITGSELLESYKPGEAVEFLEVNGSRQSSFKEPMGIVSHCISACKDKYYKCVIKYFSDLLCVEVWKDANSQIIIETLEEHMNMRAKFSIIS